MRGIVVDGLGDEVIGATGNGERNQKTGLLLMMLRSVHSV